MSEAVFRMRDEWWQDVGDAVAMLLFDAALRPMLHVVMNSRAPRYNSQQALIEALRTGRVSYADGRFTGSFSAAVARELRKFATYNPSTKSYQGTPPPAVLGAAVTAQERGRELRQRLDSQVERVPERLDALLRGGDMLPTPPTEAMDATMEEHLNTLGVRPEMTEQLRTQLNTEYINNLELDIKGWLPEQTARLREMVEQYAVRGFRRDELREMIQREWEVTANKAAFWARNETSLLTAALRDHRYQEAGITRYRWSSIADRRRRPLHEQLHGKVFSYSSPPVIDEATGKRGNPGEIWNCRCTAVPILPGQ